MIRKETFHSICTCSVLLRYGPGHNISYKTECVPCELRSACTSAHLIKVFTGHFIDRQGFKASLAVTAKTDQTGRIARLIGVFSGRTRNLIGNAWPGSCNVHEILRDLKGNIFQNQFIFITAKVSAIWRLLNVSMCFNIE